METRVEPKSNERIYIPVIGITEITAKQAMGKVHIALASNPEHICGVAHRVGYTGKLPTDLAIYRLKIKADDGSKVFTLPNLFVVQGGVFIDYDQWSCNRNNLI